MRSLPKYLLFLVCSLFSGFPSYFTPFIHTDEGGWAILSKFVFQGDLYKNFTDHKPPMLFIFHWLFSLGENSLLALHINSALWMALGAILFYEVLRRNFLTERQAFYAALLFSLLGGLV